MERLVKEPLLYIGLDEFGKEVSENQNSLRELLSDLDQFVELEYKILQEAGLSPEAAARLLADVSRSIRMVEGLPDIEHIYNLRDRIDESRERACDAEERLLQKDLPIDPFRSFFGALRPVGIGLGVIGGVTVITANALSSVPMPIFLASAGTGVASIGGAISVL